MVADFYTKPLQGNAFVRFRNYIMGLTSTLDEERVEKSIEKLSNLSEASNMDENPIKRGNDDSKNKEEDHHDEEQVRKTTYADVVKRHRLISLFSLSQQN